jgi:hypothetical protein
MNDSPVLLPIRSDVVAGGRFLPTPLSLLLGIYRRSVTRGYDAWRRSVAVSTLQSLGADEHVLAELVRAGVLAHWLETTRPGSAERTFLPARHPRWHEDSCLMLTPAGAQRLARQVEHAEQKDCPAVRVLPSWRASTRELWLGDKLVKRFRRPARNQELILAVFEEEGWPDVVSDPLPGRDGANAAERLHNAILRLNASQQEARVVFGRDGTGGGITWRS